MPVLLTADQLRRDLAIRDLTDPAGGPHALQLLVDDAINALRAAWPVEVRVCRGPRIIPLGDNYDDLGFAAEAVTRDARYTRYVDDGHVLRSHSTAMIPPALRALAADPADDALLVCPGVVYRRDSIDRLHTGTPHQLDLWRVSRRPLGDGDLDEMIALLAGALVPGARIRDEPRVHPYTLNGRQVDVHAETGWVEVWECGLAHPAVLARAGLRGPNAVNGPRGWGGLALGMGLDRLLMLRKGIPDIRLLRSTDSRVVAQMSDLSPYRPVSDLPAVRRDLSVAVDEDDTAEDLGDRVREALGEDGDLVEEISVLSETGYAHLPPVAVDRLGMTPGQKNVLVRLVIRPFDRTLTDAEANRVRDHVYAAVHRGRVHHWAGSGAPQ
jgi:phenylalanyl-tRNA synthetase alpha chain